MSASGDDRASTCPACGGALEPETAGFTEQGLVCQRCVLASLDADEAQRDAAPDVEDLAALGANMVGVSLLVGVGHGFAVGGPTAGERRMRELAADLPEAGHVEPTDEYWYEGMDAWRSVNEFVSPHDPF